MGNSNWKQQPIKPGGQGPILPGKLMITLSHDPMTGKIEVSANAPVTPFEVCEILSKVVQENLIAFNKEARKLINGGNQQRTIDNTGNGGTIINGGETN